MWNPEIRAKVLARLKSMPILSPDDDVKEEDIFVLPFEEVQLVHKGEFYPLVELVDGPQSYLRPSESLKFHLLCDSASVAKDFAEDFRRTPELVLNSTQMTLECRRLSIRFQSKSQVNFKYNITTFSNSDSSSYASAQSTKESVSISSISPGPPI